MDAKVVKSSFNCIFDWFYFTSNRKIEQIIIGVNSTFFLVLYEKIDWFDSILHRNISAILRAVYEKRKKKTILPTCIILIRTCNIHYFFVLIWFSLQFNINLPPSYFTIENIQSAESFNLLEMENWGEFHFILFIFLDLFSQLLVEMNTSVNVRCQHKRCITTRRIIDKWTLVTQLYCEFYGQYSFLTSNIYLEIRWKNAKLQCLCVLII